jgi:hypothetical protein
MFQRSFRHINAERIRVLEKELDDTIDVLKPAAIASAIARSMSRRLLMLAPCVI